MIDRALQWVFGGLIIASPLVFVPASPDDVFVWPRVMVIGALTILATALLTARAVLIAGYPVAYVKAVDWALLAMLASGVISWLFSIDRGLSLAGEPMQYRGLAATLVIPVFVMLGRYVGASGRWRLVLTKPVVIATGIVAGFAVLQQVGLDPWWDELAQNRSFSTLGQPNVLGITVLMLGLMVAILLPGLGRRWRKWGAVAAVLAPVALVASVSRGAFLAAVLSIALVGWLVRPRLRLRSVVFSIGLAALLVLSIAPLRTVTSNAGDRIAATAESEPDGSVAMRMDLWAVGTEMVVRRPIFGWGQDTYATVFPEIDNEVLDQQSRDVLDAFRPESPHNLVLEVAQGSGLVGLAALVVVLVSSLRVIHRWDGGRDHTLRTMVLAVAVAYLVAAQFMTSEWAASTIFWLVLGVGVGAASSCPARHKAADFDVPRHKSKLVLWVILLSAVALRLPALTTSLWTDEAYSAVYYIPRGPAAIFDPAQYLPNNHVGFNLAGWILTRWLPSSEAVLRLLSLVPALAAVWLLWWWARGRFGGRVAMLASILLVAAPIHLELSVQARGYGVGFLSAVGMLVGADLASERGGRWYWLFGGSALLGIWTLPQLALLFAGHGAGAGRVRPAALPDRRRGCADRDVHSRFLLAAPVVDRRTSRSGRRKIRLSGLDTRHRGRSGNPSPGAPHRNIRAKCCECGSGCVDSGRGADHDRPQTIR